MQSETKNFPYRFPFSNTEAWLAHLHEKGFVVVEAISKDDCKRIVGEMKQSLQQLSKALNNEEAWSVESSYPYMLHGGMIQYVGHSKFQWELREKTAPVFAKIWGCDVKDLATSFDGFCYMDGRRKYETRHPLSFLHSDQSPTRDYLWSVQGIVNLCENGENDGGLVLIPETHKIHQEIFKGLKKEDHAKDWYKFTDEEKKAEQLQKYIKICGEAGDLFLFDSRTFHCNTVPTTSNLRACVYICQVPKNKVSKEIKEQRAQLWNEKGCSNHQPGEGMHIVPIPKGVDESTLGAVKKISVAKKEDLTELQQSLLCI